ncbi:hypothetical protein CDIK_1849 [Cucumispora dikerogammari]|nr:hypothetical protein CDIK_1849 [Cucumispora dikerogammari]
MKENTNTTFILDSKKSNPKPNQLKKTINDKIPIKLSTPDNYLNNNQDIINNHESINNHNSINNINNIKLNLSKNRLTKLDTTENINKFWETMKLEDLNTYTNNYLTKNNINMNMNNKDNNSDDTKEFSFSEIESTSHSFCLSEAVVGGNIINNKSNTLFLPGTQQFIQSFHKKSNQDILPEGSVDLNKIVNINNQKLSLSATNRDANPSYSPDSKENVVPSALSNVNGTDVKQAGNKPLFIYNTVNNILIPDKQHIAPVEIITENTGKGLVKTHSGGTLDKNKYNASINNENKYNTSINNENKYNTSINNENNSINNENNSINSDNNSINDENNSINNENNSINDTKNKNKKIQKRKLFDKTKHFKNKKAVNINNPTTNLNVKTTIKDKTISQKISSLNKTNEDKSALLPLIIGRKLESAILILKIGAVFSDKITLYSFQGYVIKGKVLLKIDVTETDINENNIFKESKILTRDDVFLIKKHSKYEIKAETESKILLVFHNGE